MFQKAGYAPLIQLKEMVYGVYPTAVYPPLHHWEYMEPLWPHQRSFAVNCTSMKPSHCVASCVGGQAMQFCRMAAKWTLQNVARPLAFLVSGIRVVSYEL
jgi:hypothetical protein